MKIAANVGANKNARDPEGKAGIEKIRLACVLRVGHHSEFKGFTIALTTMNLDVIFLHQDPSISHHVRHGFVSPRSAVSAIFKL